VIQVFDELKEAGKTHLVHVALAPEQVKQLALHAKQDPEDK
jgi:hypothetical protein